jgi:hypothetical protein
MKKLALALCAPMFMLAADGLPWRQKGIESDAGWSRWAAREEIAPRTFVSAGALAIRRR